MGNEDGIIYLSVILGTGEGKGKSFATCTNIQRTATGVSHLVPGPGEGGSFKVF